MAPKLFSGLVKMIKPKRRKSKKPETTTTTTANTTNDGDIIATVANHRHHKPTLATSPTGVEMLGNSSTTVGSSGYLHPLDEEHPTMTTCTSTDETSTWCGSSDSDSPGSPLVLRRPKALSATSRRCQSHTAAFGPPRTSLLLQQQHHHTSLSFRLRKRNRALSDVDFDQLLTQSRGWTFDPNSDNTASCSRQTHTRHLALAQTDFERYIFAPTSCSRLNKDASRRVSAPPTSVDASSCATPPPSVASSDVVPLMALSPSPETTTTTSTPWERRRQEPMHPFLRPLESCYNGSCHFEAEA